MNQTDSIIPRKEAVTESDLLYLFNRSWQLSEADNSGVAYMYSHLPRVMAIANAVNYLVVRSNRGTMA